MPKLRPPFNRPSHALWLGLVALLWIPFALLADDAPADPPFTSTFFDTRDGLPQNSVHGLALDPDGFLWIGTLGGVARYDGHRFDHYNQRNTKGFPSAGISALLATEDRSVWIATTRGLYRMLPNRREVVLEEATPGYSVGLVSVGDEVVVSGEWGMARGRPGKSWSANTNLVVAAIAVVPGEVLWVAAKEELLRIPLPLSDPGSKPRAVMRGHSGRNMVVHKGALWLRMGRDLLQLDARSGEVLHRWPGLDADPRFVDGLGNVWLMATNDLEIRVTVPGLLDPVERKFLGMSPRLGFYGNVTSAQALDQDGTIWLGTFDKGLARLRPSRVETYDQRHGLPHRAVSAVHGGPGLGLWVQTDHGVARRVGDRFEAWTKSSIPTKRSLLALDSETALVAGDQLQRFAAGKEPEVIGPDVSGVSLVGKDRGGRWVVGNGETLWRESAAGQWFEERGTPTNRSWHSWEEGRRGEVFLGTVGRGLFHRPPGGAWESVNLPGNPSAAAVLWWEDGWRPWLGSQTGLYRLRDGDGLQWDRWTETEGLDEDLVIGMQPDGQGRLWLLGHKGIHRVAITNLLDVARGRAPKVYTYTLDMDDGLPSNEGNDGSPSSTRDGDGNLWFATAAGLVRLRPKAIPDALRPRPLVTGVSIVGDDALSRAVEREGEEPVAFGNGQGRNLRFRFTAPLPSAGRRVHLKYRIEAVNRAWIEADASREAIYASLKPGLHHFEVIASAADGPWSDVPARWSFRIEPLWWERTDVRIGAVALVLAGIVLLFLRRLRLQAQMAALRQVQAIEDERSRLARDMHDGIGSELARVNLAAAAGPVDAGTVSRDLLQRLQTLVWLTDPAEDRLDAFLGSMAARVERFFPHAPPAVHIRLPDSIPSLPLDGRIRREVVGWLDEGLANVARHARAGQIRFEVRFVPGAFEVVLADDGRGFDPSAPQPASGGGHGLQNMHQRIQSLGGQLEVRSAPGMGTEIRARIPWAK
ncbi:MAG: two-component regulator propeller domain-containing protein [Verrucomicrobiota bacterium]|jgi:signal transduction histidine kinase/ligand-binding sensor domain-containing protein